MRQPKQVHFLLVEDDDAHAELAMMELGRVGQGVTVDRVADGAAALEYLRRTGTYTQARRPDVVLLDLKLPRLDGHEVLQAIKGDALLQTIPVVVLTTSDAETDRVRAYFRHANSYVVKPLDFESFQRVVREVEEYWGRYNQPPPSAGQARAG